MSTTTRQQHATPQAATTATTDATDTRPLVIDQYACMEAISGLQDMLASRTIWEIDEYKTDPDFAAFAKGALGLARLATALHEYRVAPQADGASHLTGIPDGPLPQTVADLRARLDIILTEPGIPGPVNTTAIDHDTMLGFVFGLHEAVKTCALPRNEDVSRESGRALGHLAALAGALYEAASAASSQVLRQCYDLNRALGRDPYDTRPMGETDSAPPSAPEADADHQRRDA